jgi:cyclic beta-1,2-glucan synthetase
MNPEHRCSGVRSAEVDGLPADPQVIPLRDDGQTHDVVIVLGEATASAARITPVGAAQWER